MANLWDDVKNAIVDGYVYAADKAEEVSQIGKARMEILRFNRKIARAMSEIGGRVFEIYEEGAAATLPEDGQIRDAVETIRDYRLEIRRLEAEIEKVKSERETKPAE